MLRTTKITPTSLLDLALELRDGIYRLIIPIERGADDEPLPIETEKHTGKIILIPRHLRHFGTDLCRQSQKMFFAWEGDC